MAWSRYQVIVHRILLLIGLITYTQALPRTARAPAHEEEDSGLWGLWGQWSTCSRTCGGGVSYQERECLIDDVHGTECVGKSKRYESCNIQECPEGSLDFRAEQCAQFNAVPYEGRYYEWVPYLGAANQCELNCMPRGQHFYYRLKDRVTDGTRCSADKLDVCVEGECQRVGCDFMLGSDAKEDKCRECKGDGSTCKTIEGQFTLRRLPVGYNDILIIPAGATNIKIEERKPTENYLALRNANGQYYINGNFSIDFPQPFSVAGTTVHYERYRGDRKKSRVPEVFRALGPTSEPLFVVLVTQEKNKGILYEYSVPADSKAATNPDSYSWIYGSYEECSQSCGGGVQFREVSCARNDDFKVVPDYLCDLQLKPSTNQTCNVDSCPPRSYMRWFVGDWSMCSKDCGGGEQVRLVYCEQVEKVQGSPKTKMVSDNKCAQFIGNKPPVRQPCNEKSCPDWTVGEWSKCSESCGPGIQTRRVTCDTNDIILGLTCDVNEKPVHRQECNLRPCQGVEWFTSDWTPCSEQCGHGMQTRQIYCGSFDGLIYKSDLCEGQVKPKHMKSCESKATCSAEWHASKWSECSSECGEGMRSRNVICARMVGHSWRRVPESQCHSTEKFSDMEHCNNGPCEGSMWLNGPWSECSASCGGGQRERHVFCMGPTISESLCDSDAKPTAVEACNEEICENDPEEGSGSPLESDEPTPTPLSTARIALTPSVQTSLSEITTLPPPVPTTLISCELTQFGCCPNGFDTATGPEGRGCERGRNDNRCTKPRDTGTICAEYAIKWYYDTDYNRCTQFWYGGCDGNNNRFDSEEDCKQECGDDMNELPQEELCSQPMTEGPCKAAIPSYYYNMETGTCEHFLYGGCKGNNNRFRMIQECEIMCGTMNRDPCSLPRDAGRCTGKQPRRMYYFDQSSGLCEQFYYSGCHGNPNRFEDKESCQVTCNVVGIDESSIVIPERPRYSCEDHKREAAMLSAERHPNIFIPQCTLDGEYVPMQCHKSTGDCWCVDEYGMEFNGSRKAPGLHVQRPDCSMYKEQLTTCQRHRKTALGDAEVPSVDKYIPQCDEAGEYKQIQCYGSSGYCWCVNENGEETEGSRISPGNGPPNCNPSASEKPACFKLRDAITSGAETGVYIPECTPNGLFSRLQCEGADECLCVNETTGDVLFPIGQAIVQGYSEECNEAHQPETTECQRHRSRILSENGEKPGSYVPECDMTGEYEARQCYGSTGFCWCVNKHGEEIENTMTAAGFDTPDCLEARRRVSPCFAEVEDTTNSGLIGAHVPQCTDSGLYERVQCHGSTGFCHCVDETTGVMFHGSRAESRGVRPDCTQYYNQELPEILPEITKAPTPSIPTTPRIPIKPIPIGETLTTKPSMSGIEIGVITDNHESMGLVTLATDRCEYTEYGCCPDGKTASPTEDYLECPGVAEPAINVGTGHVTALLDGTVTLHCHATGIPEPYIMWYREGQKIDEASDNRMYVADDGSLTITFVQESDVGVYECKAYNGIGQMPKETVELSVFKPADIPLRGQTAVTVQEGSTAILDCLATGDPKPTVTWTTTEEITLPGEEQRMLQAENDSLIISDAKVGDSGTYVCTGKGLFGIVQKKEITLIVEADVRIITPPHNTTVDKGDMIVLTCGSTGSPRPTIRWSVNDIPISKMSSHHNRFTISSNGDLTIDKIKKSDSGLYECTAANGQSSQSASATVTVSKVEETDSSCTDRPDLANCVLIVAANFCEVQPYNEYCCRTCRENNRR